MRFWAKKITASKVLLTVCRFALAIVFIWAAAGKIANPAKFADNVAAFKMIPVTSVNVFAIILPWVEMLVGLALLSGVMLRSAAMLSMLLNLVFLFAVGSAMARGLDIECGCFTLSKEHDRVGWSLIARDILFIILSLQVMFSSKIKGSRVEHKADELPLKEPDEQVAVSTRNS
ncbi:MAG: MauE/DoxX family redox-associated membrane protein [Armatimonadota bacterium]